MTRFFVSNLLTLCYNKVRNCWFFSQDMKNFENIIPTSKLKHNHEKRKKSFLKSTNLSNFIEQLFIICSLESFFTRCANYRPDLPKIKKLKKSLWHQQKLIESVTYTIIFRQNTLETAEELVFWSSYLISLLMVLIWFQVRSNWFPLVLSSNFKPTLVETLANCPSVGWYLLFSISLRIPTKRSFLLRAAKRVSARRFSSLIITPTKITELLIYLSNS